MTRRGGHPTDIRHAGLPDRRHPVRHAPTDEYRLMCSVRDDGVVEGSLPVPMTPRLRCVAVPAPATSVERLRSALALVQLRGGSIVIEDPVARHVGRLAELTVVNGEIALELRDGGAKPPVVAAHPTVVATRAPAPGGGGGLSVVARPRTTVSGWSDFVSRFAPEDLRRVLDRLRLHGRPTVSSTAEEAELAWLLRAARRPGSRVLCSTGDVARSAAVFAAITAVSSRKSGATADERLLLVGSDARFTDLYDGLSVAGGGKVTDAFPTGLLWGGAWMRPGALDADCDVLAVRSAKQLLGVSAPRVGCVLILENALRRHGEYDALQQWLAVYRPRSVVYLTDNPFGVASSGKDAPVTLITAEPDARPRRAALELMPDDELSGALTEGWRALAQLRGRRSERLRLRAVGLLVLIERLPVAPSVYDRRLATSPFRAGVAERLAEVRGLAAEIEDNDVAVELVKAVAEAVERLEIDNPKHERIASRPHRPVGVSNATVRGLVEETTNCTDVRVITDLGASAETTVLVGALYRHELGVLLRRDDCRILCYASEARRMMRSFERQERDLNVLLAEDALGRGLADVVGFPLAVGWTPAIPKWELAVEPKGSVVVAANGLDQEAIAGAVTSDPYADPPLSGDDFEASTATASDPRLMGDLRSARLVVLQDGRGILLGSHDTALCIRANGEPVEVMADDLQGGETLLLVLGDARRRLYEAIRERTRDHPRFAGHWANVDLWRNVLRSWAEVSGGSDDLLLARLQAAGSRRQTAQTVRGWRLGQVIGPMDPEDLRRIATMAGSRELLERYPVVVASIRRLRNIQGIVMQHLVRTAGHVGRATSGDPVIDDELGLRMSDLADLVEIVRVASVDDRELTVPASSVGTVFDRA